MLVENKIFQTFAIAVFQLSNNLLRAKELDESNFASDRVGSTAKVPIDASVLAILFVAEDLHALLEFEIESQYCELLNANVPRPACASKYLEIEESVVRKLQTLDSPGMPIVIVKYRFKRLKINMAFANPFTISTVGSSPRYTNSLEFRSSVNGRPSRRRS